MERNGPRAVLGSQRVRLHEAHGMMLDALLHLWLLRAEDGSRSGGDVRMLRGLVTARCGEFLAKVILIGSSQV